MLFGMSTIFWQRSHDPVVNIFRDSCFKIGQFQPSVAYKSVAYKKSVSQRGTLTVGATGANPPSEFSGEGRGDMSEFFRGGGRRAK